MRVGPFSLVHPVPPQRLPMQATAPLSVPVESVGSVAPDEAARVIFETRQPDAALQWSQSVGPGSRCPVRLGDGTLVMSADREVRGFKPDGSSAWPAVATPDFELGAPVRGAGNTLYVTGDRAITAVTPSGVAWSHPLPRGSSGPVVGADGTVYVTTPERELRAYNPDGVAKETIKWAPMRTLEPKPLTDGRLVLYGHDNRIAIFNPRAPIEGMREAHTAPRVETEWQGTLFHPVGVAPDGACFELTDDKTLTAYEPGGKTVRWRYVLPTPEHRLSVRQRPDGVIYVMRGNNHAVTALSPQGQHLWDWEPTEPIGTDFVMDGAGVMYFPGTRGNHLIYALGPDGRERWRLDIRGYCRDLSLGPESTLLVSGERSVRIIDRDTGIEQAVLPTRALDTLGLDDGTIYATTDNGELQAWRYRSLRVVDEERLAEASKAPASSGPRKEIKRDEGTVVIGGVRVPVRTG